jgi:peptide/nickel transport system substrate-binding protein
MENRTKNAVYLPKSNTALPTQGPDPVNKAIRIYLWTVLLLMPFLGLFLKAEAESRPGGELVVLVPTGTPGSLNSAVASGYSTFMISSQIFASPIRFDEHWHPKPYLARRWEVSKDGLSVTLHLEEGALFHDGHPITSEDVAFSVMTVKAYSPFKDAMTPVERVDTPDPHTAVLRLKHPYPAILTLLSPPFLPILPKHVYGNGQDVRHHPANLKPVGSGPYRFVRNVNGKEIVLERNPAFFIRGRPHMDRLIFRIEPNVRFQMVEMERQEAHLLPYLVNPDGVARSEENNLVTVTDKGYAAVGAITWVEFNLLRTPLADRRVRQAIAYAADREFITGFLHGGKSRIATGPITPESPFYEPLVPRYGVNFQKAGELLDAAGYPIKADGTRLSLTLDYPAPLPSQLRDVALYLKEQLAKIGIVLGTRKWDKFSAWIKHVANWEYDMTMNMVSNYGDPVIGVQRTYLSSNIKKGVMFTNCTHYRNPMVDECLSRAATEMDSERRKALYSEFQKRVVEDLPVFWINVVPFHTVYHKGLENPPLSIWGILSPMDEIFWKDPPHKDYMPTPQTTAQSPLVKRVGVAAIRLLKQKGLHQAMAALADPREGLLDLTGNGLHVIGFTTKGIVFLDNSGQIRPGMDIGGIVDLEGRKILSRFVDTAKKKDGGILTSAGIWPHPETHQTETMWAWCGMLTPDDVVCALSWEEMPGDRKCD